MRVLYNSNERNNRLLLKWQRNPNKVIKRNKSLWEKLIYTIENHRNNNNPKIFFKKANKIKDEFKTKPTAMKKSNRTLLTKCKEINANSKICPKNLRK